MQSATELGWHLTCVENLFCERYYLPSLILLFYVYSVLVRVTWLAQALPWVPWAVQQARDEQRLWSVSPGNPLHLPARSRPPPLEESSSWSSCPPERRKYEKVSKDASYFCNCAETAGIDTICTSITCQWNSKSYHMHTCLNVDFFKIIYCTCLSYIYHIQDSPHHLSSHMDIRYTVCQAHCYLLSLIFVKV